MTAKDHGRAKVDEANQYATAAGERKAEGGVSLVQSGEAGREVALQVARVAMGLEPINGHDYFYRAPDGTFGIVVDEKTFRTLEA